MFSYRETLSINFWRKVILTTEHGVAILENPTHIFPRPLLDQPCSFRIEHFLFEDDAYVFEDGERYEALMRAVASPIIDDIGHGIFPTGIGCV